jgi:hypothetical protein
MAFLLIEYDSMILNIGLYTISRIRYEVIVGLHSKNRVLNKEKTDIWN